MMMQCGLSSNSFDHLLLLLLLLLADWVYLLLHLTEVSLAVFRAE